MAVPAICHSKVRRKIKRCIISFEDSKGRKRLVAVPNICHSKVGGKMDRRSNLSTTSSIKRRSSRDSKGRKRLSSISELEEPNSAQIVAPIMAEILDRALDRIHTQYMERQTVKFVVHCAHQALTRFLRFHFYQHNEYERKVELWGPDRTIAPSPPDSWALGQVHFYDTIPPSPEIPFRDLDNMRRQVGEDGIEEVAVMDSELPSEPSESLLEDIKSYLEELLNNLPYSEMESVTTDEGSEMSEFSSIAQGKKPYKDSKMKSHLSRIMLGPSTVFKLPRIEARLSTAGSKKLFSEMELATAEKLPPIRIDAKYNYGRFSSTNTKVKKEKK